MFHEANRGNRLSGVLERHCETVGRDPSEIRKTVQVQIRIVNDEQKAADLRGGPDWKMIGPPQYVIDRAQDFIDAGVLPRPRLRDEKLPRKICRRERSDRRRMS